MIANWDAGLTMEEWMPIENIKGLREKLKTKEKMVARERDKS